MVALGGLHVGAPDRPGCRAAEAGIAARERVPGPHRSREQRRVADEPGVRQAVGGAGLAGLRATADRGVAGAGALGDHALEDARDLVGLPGREDPVARLAGWPVDVAVSEYDLGNRRWLVAYAAVGEGGVGAGHLERRSSPVEPADRRCRRDVATCAALAG